MLVRQRMPKPNSRMVAEAYAALKDPEKRAEYDELRKYGQDGQSFTPPPGWQPTGIIVVISQISLNRSLVAVPPHTQSRGQQTQHKTHFSFRGQDIETELPIFLEETLSDENKKLSHIICRSMIKKRRRTGGY